MVLRSLLLPLILSASTTVTFGWASQKDISVLFHRLQFHVIRASKLPRRESLILASRWPDECQDGENFFYGTVSILDRGENYLVASKPPGVLCHHSNWSGSRKKSKNTGKAEVPMLQRAREAVGKRVNLIHRLDRGASGCLLMSFAESDKDGSNTTATLQENMSLSPTTHKTYIALVRGEGILKGRDFTREGWFEIIRPIKNERGNIKNATSYFRFIAGQGDKNGARGDRPRASLVLARIRTGRWHQIRKHLNGISHPIIGDSTHGNSRTNREWKEKWGLQSERTCLHLLKLDLPPTTVTPDGISVVDALPPDMMNILQKHFSPEFMDTAERALNEEGLCLNPETDPAVISIKVAMP
mmetsp:Transcript_26773/g.62909  ORF Transcript_26773/g.62909 Transcript_26773/m.62909 type:complete len:357 (+) Transcript_26773:26-1096(+)